MTDDLSPMFDEKNLKITHAIVGGHVLEMRGGRLTEPALTAEEWEDAFGGESVVLPLGQSLPLVHVDKPDEWYGTPHQIAALALYGQPFGFTRKDVLYLRFLASQHTGLDNQGINDLADRIEALLPPEGRTSSEEQTRIQAQRAPHAKTCSVRDKAYCGGPCTCGLVDPSVYDPLALTPLPPEG